MFHDDAGRRAPRVKLGHAFVCRVGIVDVVVRELFALELPRGGDARPLFARAIERGRLMWIFAVAQRLDEMPADRTERGRGVRELVCEPIGDGCVVNSSAGIGLGGESTAQLERGRPAVVA